MHSLILFAHGARDPQWSGPLLRLRDAVLARQPDAVVQLAFLEFMDPTLPAAIDAAVAAGAQHVRIIPVFLAQGGHVKREVPLLLASARERHPGVVIELGPTLGEMQTVIDAMASAISMPE